MSRYRAAQRLSAEVAFDVPYQDYSWMEYLAQAGFDAFAMDTTGYGRSTRPAAMNDPCNLSPAQQLALGRAEACSPSYGQQMTTHWPAVRGSDGSPGLNHPELPLQAGGRGRVLEHQPLVREDVVIGFLGHQGSLVEAAQD